MLSITLALLSTSPSKRTSAADLRLRGYQYSFSEYQAEFNKTYTPAELPRREAAFLSTLAQIREHNEQMPAPSWRMGLSEHADKSAEEWAQLKGLHRPSFFAHHASLRAPLNVAANTKVPLTIDWRDEGVVTPVKNQLGCGSCWAFSATESVESALAMATRTVEGKPELVELAPQQLVDCAPNPDDCGGTGGCEGSTQPLAFSYLVSAGGMDASGDYPYKAEDGTCKAGSLSPVVGIKGQVDLPTNNYTALISALASAGPIAISVDASWGLYEGGIFEPSSSGIATTIDHAVQLVGYGSEGGKDYWLVRNSWGTSWGEEGYIRLRRYGEGKEPCGTDTSPGDGFGCKGGPSSIQVCGTSGMLSGSSYPTGAYKI